MIGYYLPKLVGICGRKGSGKDTAVKKLIEEYNYKLIKFAGPLKSMLNALLETQGLSLQMRERMIEGDLKEVPSGYLGGRSPRYAMQTLGTEWGRDLIASDFWTQCFVNQINLEDNTRYVCTDMRFSNEAQLISDLGGFKVRIVRPTLNNQYSNHQSEVEIDNLIVDKELKNEGSKEEIQDALINYIVYDCITLSQERPSSKYVSIN